MFCQKCGQEQASESLRFCSRCGFKLNTGEESVVRSFIKIAMFLILTICAIAGWGSFKSGPDYMQVRVFITLVAAFTFYLLFSRDLKHIFYKTLSQNNEQVKQINSSAHERVLPPPQSMPVSMLGSHRVNTAEMAQQPSVTEQTTLLLDKNRR